MRFLVQNLIVLKILEMYYFELVSLNVMTRKSQRVTLMHLVLFLVEIFFDHEIQLNSLDEF